MQPKAFDELYLSYGITDVAPYQMLEIIPVVKP